MKQFLTIIFVILLAGCGDSATSPATSPATSSAKPTDNQIDCQAEDAFGSGDLFRTFFGFIDDDRWSKLPDGEVTVTIKTNLSKGEFKKNDMAMVPYIKSGNTFAPKYPQHWDSFRPDENMDTSGNVVIECFATMVVSKP
jgi:hypothetical protein